MREPFNTTVTIFKNLREPKGTPTDINLDEVYTRIKKGNPTLIDKIKTIRTTTDSKLKGETKNSLMCIQFNGTFKERTGAGFIEHSGMCILDFDKYPDLETQTAERERLIKDKHTLMVFTSPSGNGLKALIRIPKCNKEEHKKRALTFAKHFNSKYFDIAQTTIEQTCFESYDPDIYQNVFCEEFTLIEETKEKINTNIKPIINTPGLSPFEDYNNRGDVVELLERNGWKVVSNTGNKVNLLRPGSTDTATSGNFHTDKRTFSVFSSSTIFDVTDSKGDKKAYSPSQVYTILECNGDFKESYKKLLAGGYGEPFSNGHTDKLFKTEVIKVIGVNRVNTKNYNLSLPGETLNSQVLKETIGDEILITSTGIESSAEVVGAIDFIHSINKRIYVIENGEEIRAYKYKLNYIFTKYSTIQSSKGSLTDRDVDNLLAEVVELSANLEPIDKAILLKEFLDLEPIQRLGITKESIDITVDRLTTNRDKELQAKDFKRLLTEATQLQDKGETAKALDLITDKIKEVKLKDKTTEFSNLLTPIKETELRDRQSNKPESLKSGYTIGGEELLLPSGAITVLTAPTSHGKTTFLINLALNVAEAYPDKQAYLFSYEEDSDSILIKTLNTYLDTPISGNNRTTLENYYSGKNKTSLPEGKDKFYTDLIDTKRLSIHYSNYDSDTLIEAIRYLNKHAKPGAIFIDYIQLLNLPQGKYKTYSRQEEIKEICIALKDVAVETGLPIILGAQFNREVINLTKIHATKIGEAGDIERIANTIIGFWNTNFLGLATEGEIKEINSKGWISNSIYATVLKNRNGKVGGEEFLEFNGNTGKIKNRDNKIDPFK
jgi:replicative DNA helicase